MNWSNVDGFIFDVDGTLYPQKTVRLRMFFRLIRALLTGSLSIRELYSIYYFRKIKEQSEFKHCNIDDLCLQVSQKVGLSKERVSCSTNKWMFEVPLDLLREHCYLDVRQFINHQHNAGKTIVIYSDYPVAEKLKAMGIHFNREFVSCFGGITQSKPSLGAMEKILNEIGLSPDSLVYVGDRNDKDKVSAEMVNIKYYDISHFRKLL